MLSYSELGEQHLPPLFLLHGLFGDRNNLKKVGQALAESHRVILADLLNHGDSPWLSQCTYQQQAEAVMALADALGIPSFAVLGHSMGGKVAMQLAQSFPDRIERIIVADIAPRTYEHRHDSVVDGLHAVALNTVSQRRDAEAQMSAHISEFSTRQFLLKSLAKTKHGFAWKFNLAEITTHYALIAASPALTHSYDKSVLFIKGELSDYLQAQDQATINTYFPNAQLKVIQGTGHWLHAEKPDLFSRLCLRFLES